MTTLVEGVANLVVARVPFGNVVLLPVPPAGLGEDSVKITHGVSTPPPYPYAGAYLWAQKTDTAELRPKHTETEEPSGPSRFVGLIALLAALSLSGLVIRKRNAQTPAP